MNPISILDRLASLDTNTVSDALDFLGLPGARHQRISATLAQ